MNIKLHDSELSGNFHKIRMRLGLARVAQWLVVANEEVRAPPGHRGLPGID